jgi:riboflavin transporter FmnP
MKFLICLLITLGVAYGTILPLKPNCAAAFCTMDLKICPDGTPAPVPVDGCCPSLSACKTGIKPPLCAVVMCAMQVCPDGTLAPVPVGGCCPSLAACKTTAVGSRSNPLGSLGSLLSGSNLLQTLSTATHGTNLGTAISIVNLLNNIQQLSIDVHQIPLLINQTLVGILNGTGQAGQIILDQLMSAVTSAVHPDAASRDLLGMLGQNANLLSGISHLLPQGTSISSVMSVLKLLSNINALSGDIHKIPALINQTLTSLVGGAGQASQIVVQQLLDLVGIHSQPASRNLLGALGQNANLLSTISHLLPQGTSISTVLSLLNLLTNVNALNNDLHHIPVVLQETLQNLLSGAQNLFPSALQPVQGSL